MSTPPPSLPSSRSTSPSPRADSSDEDCSSSTSTISSPSTASAAVGSEILGATCSGYYDYEDTSPLEQKSVSGVDNDIDPESLALIQQLQRDEQLEAEQEQNIVLMERFGGMCLSETVVQQKVLQKILDSIGHVLSVALPDTANSLTMFLRKNGDFYKAVLGLDLLGEDEGFPYAEEAIALLTSLEASLGKSYFAIIGISFSEDDQNQTDSVLGPLVVWMFELREFMTRISAFMD